MNFCMFYEFWKNKQFFFIVNIFSFINLALGYGKRKNRKGQPSAPEFIQEPESQVAGQRETLKLYCR